MIRRILGTPAPLNLLLLLFLALPAWAQAALPGVPETFPQAPILEPGRLAPALFSLGRPEEKAPGTRRGLPPDPGPPSAQRPQSHGAARIIWLRFVVYREGVVSRGMTIGVLRRHRYDAYGVVLSEETYTPAAGALTDTQITSGLKYKGQTFDAETGQVYLRNRYYEPETGQFTQVDPARAGDNWYGYTTDPINRYDPSGLDWVWVGAGNGQYGPDKGWRWVPNAEGGTPSDQLEEYDYNLVEGVDPPEWATPNWAGRRVGQVVRTANAVGRRFGTLNQNDQRFANLMAEGASQGRIALPFRDFDAGFSLYNLWKDMLRDNEGVSSFVEADRAVLEIFNARRREIERINREQRPEFEFRSEQLGPATKVFAKEVGAAVLDALFIDGDVLRDHRGSGLSQGQIDDYRLAVGILSMSTLAGWKNQATKQGKKAFKRGFDDAGEVAEDAPLGAPVLPRSLGAAAAEVRVTSKIRDPFAVRHADKIEGVVQRDVDSLVAALRAGNTNPGIGTRRLSGFKGFFELRGRNRGRVIVYEVQPGEFIIAGKFAGHSKGDAANSDIIRRIVQGFKEQEGIK